MEYELTPHLKRVIIGRKISAILSILGVPTGLFYALPLEGVQFWLAFVVASSFGIFFLFKLLEVVVVWIMYGFNQQLMRDDAQSVINQQLNHQEENVEQNNATEVEFIIETLPEQPIGHYYDSPIWEWIKVKSPEGNLITAYFEDTINPKELHNYNIPTGHMLLPPGILYKLEAEDKAE